MFTKDSIHFEETLLIDMFAKDPVSLKENIIDTIFRLSSKIISELGITTLNNVIIRKQILFDSKRGVVFIRSGDVQLSYLTAIDLIQSEDTERFKKGLATLRHELVHVYDRQMVLLKIHSKLSDNGADGYAVWTEFYATHSTFYIQEDDSLYDAFENVFNNGGDKKYYLSRVLGYYLHSEHSTRCDRLLSVNIGKQLLAEITIMLKIMLAKYPHIDICHFASLNNLIEKALNTPIELGEPIDIYDWLRKKQNK